MNHSLHPAEQRRQILKALLDGADVHATDKNGVTPLHHAVRFRSPMAVKVLIEKGADVNQACRRNGSTALHRATTQTGAPGTAGRVTRNDGDVAQHFADLEGVTPL